jgi:2-dehydro-3-deoxyphosphogluconate aldolase / (4S)-4-hydroxy-2-oxoglutarate aldolase
MRSSAWVASWGSSDVPGSIVSTTLAELLGAQRVLPLVEVDDTSQAIQLARVLVDLGSPVMEIALRTPGAVSALEAIASSVEGAVVGAGTVVASDQLAVVAAAGASFAVSPGWSASLQSAAATCRIPFVPGFATATELMGVAASGIREAKFFPAEAAGGVPALAAMGALMPSMRFLPTGGIGAGSAPAYLSLAQVFAVGGSWVCPAELIRDGGWDEIAGRVRAASVLGAPGTS